MENINVSTQENYKRKKHYGYCNSPGAVYGLGFVGAAIYFIQNANTFWIGVLGILKAIIWPVLFVYKLFGFLSL